MGALKHGSGEIHILGSYIFSIDGSEVTDHQFRPVEKTAVKCGLGKITELQIRANENRMIEKTSAEIGFAQDALTHIDLGHFAVTEI